LTIQNALFTYVGEKKLSDFFSIFKFKVLKTYLTVLRENCVRGHTVAVFVVINTYILFENNTIVIKSYGARPRRSTGLENGTLVGSPFFSI